MLSKIDVPCIRLLQFYYLLLRKIIPLLQKVAVTAPDNYLLCQLVPFANELENLLKNRRMFL